MRSFLAAFTCAMLLTAAMAASGICAEPATADANASAERQQDAEDLNIGDKAPAFKNLIGVDDKKHSLKDYGDAKAVAIIFTCNHCPVAVAYEDRLIELQKDYADQRVQLVAINVNNLEADKLPAMKERAEEKGFNFSYLYDPTQEIGREYGATVTPHVFLLDQQRQLAYEGPVDDNMTESKVEKQYLRQAIDAVLDGTRPETTQAKPFGCAIRYE